MAKLFKIILSVALGALFAYLACRNVELGRVWALIAGAKPGYILLAALVYVYTQALRAERWRVLLNSNGKKYGFWDCFKMFWLSVFANYTLPARLGEFTRPVLMKKIYGESASGMLGIVAVERIFDLMGQVLLFLFVAVFVPSDYLNTRFSSTVNVTLKQAIGAIGAIGLLGFVVLFSLRSRMDSVEWLLGKILLSFPALAARIAKMLRAFFDGLGTVATPGRFLLVLFYTLASWWISAVTIMLGLFSMGIHPPDPYIASCFVQAVISIALVIPPPPGFIGTFHYFCKQGLIFYGVAEETALSYAVLYHGIQIALLVALGVAFLVSYGISFSNLISSDEKQD